MHLSLRVDCKGDAGFDGGRLDAWGRRSMGALAHLCEA